MQHLGSMTSMMLLMPRVEHVSGKPLVQRSRAWRPQVAGPALPLGTWFPVCCLYIVRRRKGRHFRGKVNSSATRFPSLKFPVLLTRLTLYVYSVVELASLVRKNVSYCLAVQVVVYICACRNFPFKSYRRDFAKVGSQKVISRAWAEGHMLLHNRLFSKRRPYIQKQRQQFQITNRVCLYLHCRATGLTHHAVPRGLSREHLSLHPTSQMQWMTRWATWSDDSDDSTPCAGENPGVSHRASRPGHPPHCNNNENLVQYSMAP
jgi:hypothetical protein